MGHKPLNEVIRQIGRAVGVKNELALPDAELLERFVGRRDEAAFTALVVRHGPLVLGVCRRLLARDPDIEDAFQATFLVLVKKAAGLRERRLLGNWLYGVAHRVAARLRAQTVRRRYREQPDADLNAVPAAETPESDLRPILDEEIGRLPRKYRRPIVLCYFEGKTNEEAAHQLQWPIGTVKGRLTRAREMLRSRLTRRGLALSAAALSPTAAPAAVSAGLFDSTVQAAIAGVVSARAAVLSQGVMRTMLLSRLKIVAALALTVGVLGTGAGFGAYHMLATEPTVVRTDDPPKSDARKKTPVKPKRDEAKLQGVWDLTANEMNGKGLEPPAKKTTWEFKDGKLYMAEDHNESKASFKLDSGKNPATLDIIVPGLGKADDEVILRAVYQLNGDTLKVCLPFGEGDRPTELTTKEGDKKVLFVFKRRVEKSKGVPDVLRRRYGDKTVAIIQGATRVEAFRIDPRDFVDPAKEQGEKKRFGGYAITATAKGQDQKFTARVAALLFDRDNFALDRAKGCKFDPGVALRFWKDKESAELLLCYNCSELKVIHPDTKAQGVQIPFADFEPGRAAFVKLAKELFAKDEAIQALKENDG